MCNDDFEILDIDLEFEAGTYKECDGVPVYDSNDICPGCGADCGECICAVMFED